MNIVPPDTNKASHAQLLTSLGRLAEFLNISGATISLDIGDGLDIHFSFPELGVDQVSTFGDAIDLPRAALGHAFPTAKTPWQLYETSGNWMGWPVRLWTSVPLAAEPDPVPVELPTRLPQPRDPVEDEAS